MIVNDKITLNFEVEKGELIAGQSHFSARIKLANESKNLLCEKLGSTIQFNNLDDYFNLNSENFYIYYNKYSGCDGRNELYVKSNDGRYLTSGLPLNHYGFSLELLSDGSAIADYGFYPLCAIYNPDYYDKAKEKVFDDHGKLLSTISDVLDKLLSNKNNLTTQDMFLQMQNEIVEKEVKLAREKRQAEEELDQKNEELKALIEKGDITLFKVIKGHDIDNEHSVVVLQCDGEGGALDSSEYYIAKYEGSEYLHCISPGYDVLLDYENLFFVLNRSFYSELESGFYSIPEFNSDNYVKYLSAENQLFSDGQLSEGLSNRQERSDNLVGQSNTEFTLDDEQVDKEVVVESEIRSRKQGIAEANDYHMEGIDYGTEEIDHFNAILDDNLKEITEIKEGVSA